MDRSSANGGRAGPMSSPMYESVLSCVMLGLSGSNSPRFKSSNSSSAKLNSSAGLSENYCIQTQWQNKNKPNTSIDFLQKI